MFPFSTRAASKEALLEFFPESDLDAVGVEGEPFSIETGSLIDYIRDDIKPSGYRAYHMNLITPVGNPGVGWELVRCELQIRTLLQDSWGELTHEDTYKPGGESSEFVETLSRRMAEVLAVMDDLAQDLRAELDRKIDQTVEDEQDDKTTVFGHIAASGQGDAGPGSVPAEESATDALGSTGPPQPLDPVGIPPKEVSLLTAQPRSEWERTGHPPALRMQPTRASETLDAVKEFVGDRFESIKEPLPLASLAWELEAEFGPEVTGDWLGFRKMSRLLDEILPSDAVMTDVPGALVPRGYNTEDAISAGSAFAGASISADVPELAKAMKAYDSSFPLLSSHDLGLAYAYLAEAHNCQHGQYGKPDARYVNMVTKMARDLASSDEEPLGRNPLNYIATALRTSGRLNNQITPELVTEAYAEFVVKRFVKLGLVKGGGYGADAQSIREWLTPQD